MPVVNDAVTGEELWEKEWLDKTTSYFCGYFLHEDDSLYQTQVNKVDYILKKLYIKKGMYLLDIGCGWRFILFMKRFDDESPAMRWY